MKKFISLILCVAILLPIVTACSSDNVGGAPSGETSLDVLKNVSDEELLAYNYIEFTSELWQIGVESDEAGLVYVADSFYGFAGANTCSMRYAVDCLLELKGSPPNEDERLRNWDIIAAIGWASPFPYFFEGVVLDARGDSAGAAECYSKAALNPNFLESMEDFKTIKDLDANALKALKTALDELEDNILESVGEWRFIFIPRDENNFDVDYLREKALACLEAEDEDLFGAYDYYYAALRLNPLDGDSYAHLVIVSLYMNVGEMVADYLGAGLAVDPENVRLNYLQDIVKEASSQ